MPNTVIQIRKSSTVAAKPLALEYGELAINYADGKMYYKNVNNFIVEFSPGGGVSFGTVNANGTLVVAGTSGDVFTLIPGSGISIVGDAINDKITISATSSGASVAVSDVAPSSPSANSLWWNSSIGKMFIYYNDGTSSQWVETQSRALDQLASNIAVNTITTYDETSNLILRTGNTLSGIMKFESNNELFISRIPIHITNSATRLDIAGEFGDYTTSFDAYAQLHMRNASSGTNASSDLVITNDIGTDTTNYIDLGINGSGYANPLFNVHSKSDGYVYTSDGNLAIGTSNTTIKEIRFHTGGNQTQNEKLVIGQGVTVGYNGTGDPGANNMNVVGDLRATSFIGFGTGFSNMNVISTLGNQVWNVPTGVKRWKVTLCGSGGSGGGTHTVAGAIGSGGGSGAVSIIYFNYVSGINTMAMNVGLAGGFTSGTNANGASGFPSNVNYNNTWGFANGGIGGANSWFGGNVSSIGLGGAASGGVLNLKGANGNIGGVAAATNPLVGTGGPTPLGLCTGGEMAVGTTAAGAQGTNAASYGGGGGGGRNASSTSAKRGGNGANGVIIIEW